MPRDGKYIEKVGKSNINTYILIDKHMQEQFLQYFIYTGVNTKHTYIYRGIYKTYIYKQG